MKRSLFALVVGLQVAWLAATAFTSHRSLVSGRVVRLETMPVDPRDLLRGDYVILSYPFSRIARDRFHPPLPADATIQAGTPVFVDLVPAGDLYQMDHATLEDTKPTPGHMRLRGQAVPWPGHNPATNAAIEVEFGLERFYVREGTGQPRGKLTVDVSVVESGVGMIRNLYLDGVPYADAMRGEERF